MHRNWLSFNHSPQISAFKSAVEMDLFSSCVWGRYVKLFLELFDVLQFIKLFMYLLHPFDVSFRLLLVNFVFLEVAQVKQFVVVGLMVQRLSLWISLFDLIASDRGRVLRGHHLLLQLLEVEVLKQEHLINELRLVLERHNAGSVIVDHQIGAIIDFLIEFALIRLKFQLLCLLRCQSACGVIWPQNSLFRRRWARFLLYPNLSGVFRSRRCLSTSHYACANQTAAFHRARQIIGLLLLCLRVFRNIRACSQNVLSRRGSLILGVSGLLGHYFRKLCELLHWGSWCSWDVFGLLIRFNVWVLLLDLSLTDVHFALLDSPVYFVATSTWRSLFAWTVLGFPIKNRGLRLRLNLWLLHFNISLLLREIVVRFEVGLRTFRTSYGCEEVILLETLFLGERQTVVT